MCWCWRRSGGGDGQVGGEVDLGHRAWAWLFCMRLVFSTRIVSRPSLFLFSSFISIFCFLRLCHTHSHTHTHSLSPHTLSLPCRGRASELR